MATGTNRDLGPCPLCGRPLLEGPSIDRHHWRPRKHGGRDWSWLHKVCHRMIHRRFSEAELAAGHDSAAALAADPDIARFVRWVRRKPADYVDWPRQPRR